ncbi:MAG TPA: serine/threonine-protein kinase [Anaeromyxobacter sp.]
MSQPAPDLSAFEPASLVGATLDGRYELTGHLATGGMGAVFRAQHVHLRKEFAVKVLRPDLTTSPDLVERFRREAEIASALEHDNIVKVSDFGRSSEGYLFLVMELLQGESLFERLRREGVLPPAAAVPILWQICSALEAAHARGVVHRDLKPENVFLARTSSGREVTKILDFGIAKFMDPASGSATQAGVVVGTPEYLAPEQAMGTAVDARADVYAVGLIAWRMLVGHHPFKAEDARGLLMMQATRPVPPMVEWRQDLAAHPALVAAVAKACEKEAGARHQSAALLGDALAAALGPAFMIPPGATPAPAPSLDGLSPVQLRELLRTPSQAGGARTKMLAILAVGRARVSRLFTERLPRAARESVHQVRAHPVAWGIGTAALIGLAVAIGMFAHSRGRAVATARELLASNRALEARAVLDDALEHRPEDPELLELHTAAEQGVVRAEQEARLSRARTLHRSGRHAEAIEAYAAARAKGPLDDVALADLVSDLGRERSLADRATRVLRDEGARAVPAVLRAAATASGNHRLRGLTLARDLGAEDQIDRVAAWTGLLADSDCELRRAAARRLGELGDAAALAALRKAAQAKTETKGGLFSKPKQTPACGAPDADAAVRRIQAARLSPRR